MVFDVDAVPVDRRPVDDQGHLGAVRALTARGGEHVGQQARYLAQHIRSDDDRAQIARHQFVLWVVLGQNGSGLRDDVDVGHDDPLNARADPIGRRLFNWRWCSTNGEGLGGYSALDEFGLARGPGQQLSDEDVHGESG